MKKNILMLKFYVLVIIAALVPSQFFSSLAVATDLSIDLFLVSSTKPINPNLTDVKDNIITEFEQRSVNVVVKEYYITSNEQFYNFKNSISEPIKKDKKRFVLCQDSEGIEILSQLASDIIDKKSYSFILFCSKPLDNLLKCVILDYTSPNIIILPEAEDRKTLRIKKGIKDIQNYSKVKDYLIMIEYTGFSGLELGQKVVKNIISTRIE